jgi:lipid-binding SYLF domain-containing protein
MQVINRVVLTVGVLLLASSAIASSQKSDDKRLNESTTVLSEIRNASDNGIPEATWSKADCVVVIPSLKKAGFIIGGEFGSGVMSCRKGNGWSAPVFMDLTKGSAGFQIGAQSTDLVLLVMNKSGVEKLLGNKTTLGADASIAAGPVGRTASAATDAQMHAEMLSYSRSKGLFAGIDLSGGALKPDDSANASAYGAGVSARDIAFGTKPVTLSAAARGFTDALSRQARATSGVK